MGKGDKKSAKGKRYKGTYGVNRNRKAIKARLKRSASSKPAVTPGVEEKPKAKRTSRKKEGPAE